MRTTKTVQIDGEDYILGHWSVEKAAEMFAWIMETFGPSFRAAYSLTGEATESNDDFDLILKFVDSISQNLAKVLPPKEYAAKLKEMVSDVATAAKGPVVFNSHFQGRILHLHKLVVEVIKYQFADFFDAALGQSGLARS